MINTIIISSALPTYMLLIANQKNPFCLVKIANWQPWTACKNIQSIPKRPAKGCHFIQFFECYFLVYLVKTLSISKYVATLTRDQKEQEFWLKRANRKSIFFGANGYSKEQDLLFIARHGDTEILGRVWLSLSIC